MKKITFILLCLLFGVGVSYSQEFNSSSVLKSGTWYKIKVAETGVYQLTYDDLRQIGFESPQNIRVYGFSGKQVPYTVNDENLESDLTEVPLYSSGGESFGSGDYYLFYGQGAENIVYDSSEALFKQEINDYANWNYYYISSSFGPGKRISVGNSGLESPTYVTSTYDYVDYFEEEVVNPDGSGRLWLSGEIDPPSFVKDFLLPNVVSTSDVTLELAMVVRSASAQTVQVSVNNSHVSTLAFSSVNLGGHEGLYASYRKTSNVFKTSSDNLSVRLDFSVSGLEDKVFVDYITINARCNLQASTDVMFFRDKFSLGNSVAEYTVGNVGTNHQVWNVTDYSNVYRAGATSGNNQLKFRDIAQEIQEYALVNVAAGHQKPIFTDDTYNDVGFLEANQNLHAITPPELLIVTHPLFLDQANRLADLHREKDAMKVYVATTDQVYNEFSSGRPEAGAIRNFAQMLYERSSGADSLRYLLLFGDGSYNNKTINELNPNYIPTFQSVESLALTKTYVSDDFYAKLNRGETIEVGEICIGVGRLPVNSDGGEELEAKLLVDKIYEYYDSKNMGDWRNNTIFLGDDGEYGWDNIVFMKDSDDLTDRIKSQDQTFNHSKIFLDAFQQISSSTGAAYPEAEEALDEAFKKGALLFNYMGHGGEEAITQEYVLSKSDFENLSNGPYYPIFVTATCQMSRYDNVKMDGGIYSKKVSAGEAALLNPNGGAIALLTTTRLVYQSSNKRLSNNIYKYFFAYNHNGDRYRLGDIYRLAKNASGSDVNTLKFALLGDPAITIPHGKYKVITDSVNNYSIAEKNDTIRALDEIVVTGYVAYEDSSLINEFNGKVYINVFDKSYVVTTLGNDDIPLMDFELQDKLLFRGLATVTDGRFKYSFKVPKDITYSFGEGKIAYYAEDGAIDAKGYYNKFYIGGTSSDAEVDLEGPEIRLYLNNDRFVDGGVTDANPVLIAQVYDTNGINTTGNGIGHDLTGVLDDDISEGFVLNDYYIGAIDDYRRGELSYPLKDLEGGYHTITVKVWDTYNNSSEETISFYVDQSNSLAINELMNYPNPANTETVFQYAHNSPGEEHTVIIDIFDASGRMVHRIERVLMEEGYVSEPLHWSFSGSGGAVRLAPGVYPYRVKVNTSEGKDGIESGRLIIIP